jgi:hypothetical protein
VLGLYLNNGEVKIFVPKTSSYWTDHAADIEVQIAQIQADEAAAANQFLSQ